MVFEFYAVGIGDGQGHAVEPPRLIGAAVLLQPGPGEPRDAPKLLVVDRLQRAAVAMRASGLDLAEDDDVGLAGDEIELASAVAPVAIEDLHPVAPQVSGGEAFADAAQPVGTDLHDVHGVPAPGRGRSRT